MALDISPFIKRVARGKHGSENLDQAEAQAVFSALLQPDADMLQLGAFLIGQRMKGESSAELAGFVTAARAHVPGFPQQFSQQSPHQSLQQSFQQSFQQIAPTGAVDLPCYAGKRRDAHTYVLAALQARDRGIPVVVHGVGQIDGRVTAWQVLQTAGVQRAMSVADAAKVLALDGIVYIDLAEMNPDLFRLYHLRARLGVRSFANTVARLLNPLQCEGQLNGFFHTPYADYMAEANVRLGQPRSLIFMGAEGEPELYADRQKVMVKQQGDRFSRVSFPAAGLPVYPREAMDAALLQDNFAMMLQGVMSERQMAVMQQMKHAFDWAAQGVLPVDWCEE